MEEIDKDKLEFMAEHFPNLEHLAKEVIQAAQNKNLYQIGAAISALNHFMKDTLDWDICPACEMFNKAESFGLDGRQSCPECGEEI